MEVSDGWLLRPHGIRCFLTVLPGKSSINAWFCARTESSHNDHVWVPSGPPRHPAVEISAKLIGQKSLRGPKAIFVDVIMDTTIAPSWPSCYRLVGRGERQRE